MANTMAKILLQVNLENERYKKQIKDLTVDKATLKRENDTLRNENTYLKELLKQKGSE